MIHKTDIDVNGRKIHFEFQEFPQATVVALDATLDDFKGIPVKDNTGQWSLKFNPKTVKDCTKIDGCVYMHLGVATDRTLVELIGYFLNALKDKTIWKHELPKIVTELKK